jgi:hypothetical protein
MPPPTPLTRRPQATALSIEDLLERVRRGEVRIPEFQRLWRWKAGDIRDLLDSVYRGYPIGTLLFWKKEAPADHLRFGPVRLDAPRSSQALWVVDGQQRITALTGVLLHPPLEGEEEHDDFAFYFDLETEEFVRRSGQARPPAHWLPLNVVLDSERLLGWLDGYAGRAEKPHHTRTAMRLGKALREYQVPAYIVEADDPEVLRVIFERLNSAGRPLTRAEVFDALHAGRGDRRPSNLRTLSEGLKDLGFGTVEEQWLLKAVLAVQGLDITRDFRQQLKGHEPLSEALGQTERALRAVIVFLKREVGIPHIELLPYKLPLVLLARFFHLHPEPSARSRELLARWVWRGAITEHHRGESIPEVRRSLKSIGPDEEDSVQKLLDGVLHDPFPEVLDLYTQEYNFRTARTKLHANMLLARRPRDLRTGHLLDIPSVLEKEGASAFAQVYTSLPPVPPDDLLGDESGLPDLRRGLANRLFHPSLEKQSLLSLLRTSPPAPAVLESHAISEEAFGALLDGNARFFLSYRQRLLDKHLHPFLESRARWDESDRGSLQSLIVPDEED